MQTPDVLWHRQYRLRNVLFHTDYPATAGLDLGTGTGDEYPDLSGGNRYCACDCIRQ